MTPQEFGEAFDTGRRQATVRQFTRERRDYRLAPASERWEMRFLMSSQVCEPSEPE